LSNKEHEPKNRATNAATINVVVFIGFFEVNLRIENVFPTLWLI
jgi:hypothetical protein